MTLPGWLTKTNNRWMIAGVVAVLLVLIGLSMRQRPRPTQGAVGQPMAVSAASRELLAPLTEGGIVSDWTLRSITTQRDGNVFLAFTKAGTTIEVRVMLWESSLGPGPRAGPYVVFYTAHGTLGSTGYTLAQAVAAAIRPHVRTSLPPEFRR